MEFDYSLMSLHNYAEVMARDVVNGEVSSIEIDDGTDRAVWTARMIEDGVVAFECDGNCIEDKFKDEKDLADLICDYFAEDADYIIY